METVGQLPSVETIQLKTSDNSTFRYKLIWLYHLASDSYSFQPPWSVTKLSTSQIFLSIKFCTHPFTFRFPANTNFTTVSNNTRPQINHGLQLQALTQLFSHHVKVALPTTHRPWVIVRELSYLFCSIFYSKSSFRCFGCCCKVVHRSRLSKYHWLVSDSIFSLVETWCWVYFWRNKCVQPYYIFSLLCETADWDDC